MKPDDWVGRKPKPKYYMDAYEYAHNYVSIFNKKPKELNDEYKNQGLGNFLQLRTLNVTFWMDADLKKERALGTYQAEGVRSHKSPSGLIKIDIRAHNDDFNKIKETIRHEITHAIAHQIKGCQDNGHNEIWRQIAIENKVNTHNYI